MKGRRGKGEQLRELIRYIPYILRIFVNAIMYPHPAQP
jgi:hypothetical protein